MVCVTANNRDPTGSTLAVQGRDLGTRQHARVAVVDQHVEHDLERLGLTGDAIEFVRVARAGRRRDERQLVGNEARLRQSRILYVLQDLDVLLIMFGPVDSQPINNEIQ
jgi:hypothetical protein